MVGLRSEDGPGAGAGTGVVPEGSTGSCLSLRPVAADGSHLSIDVLSESFVRFFESQVRCKTRAQNRSCE